MNIGDYTESIQIDYDPEKISYEDLLNVFWQGHNPHIQPYSNQYMSIIFTHDEEQKRLALESRDRIEAETGKEVVTRIEPASTFYIAEDYHQKYYLRHYGQLMKEFRAIYPDVNDFVNSTAVARVNGYVGGYGTHETVQETLGTLGLSPEALEILEELIDKGLTPACPVPVP